MDEKGEKDIWEGRTGRERGNKIRKGRKGPYMKKKERLNGGLWEMIARRGWCSIRPVPICSYRTSSKVNLHTYTLRSVLTVTFHPLVDETIQQRATVVTEGGTAVCVDLKLVFAPGVLTKQTS